MNSNSDSGNYIDNEVEEHDHRRSFAKRMKLSELADACLETWSEDCFVIITFLNDGTVTVRSLCKYGECYSGYYINKDGNIDKTKTRPGKVEYVDIDLKEFISFALQKNMKIETSKEGLLMHY